MSHFRPDFCFDSVRDITAEFLAERRIKALALDLDNTLAPYKQRSVPSAVAAWLAAMRERGIKLLVLSNAHEQRVAEFCAPLGLPFISRAQKPKREAYRRACRQLALPPEQVAMVGDQIFTDIHGAKKSGLLALCVKPIALHNPLFRLRNWVERPFLAGTPRGQQ